MSDHGPLSDAFLADDSSFVIPVRLMEMAEDRGLMQATITQTLEAVFAEIDSLRDRLDRAEPTLGAARALCRETERSYGGPVSMARVEAWVHLGALRTVLDRYPLPEETS